MKRDMDVVRRIVLSLRDANEPIEEVDGLDQQAFCMHAELLIEAGLVEGSTQRYLSNATNIPDSAFLNRLTWAGQEFADAIEDDTLWAKAKDKVIKPGVSWTFAVLGEWLKAEAKRTLGLPP
jgi:hypothetical protein